MKKRHVQAAAAILFVSILSVMAMTGGSMETGELRVLQTAIRNLRRADNLQFTYSSTSSYTGEISIMQADVWADLLTGSWAAEYYTIDNDGTRLFLKEFCDGTMTYNYIDWSGEWSVQTGEKETDVPFLESITMLNYSEADIVDFESEDAGGRKKISYGFTPEYLMQYQQMQVKDVTAIYEIDEDGMLCNGSALIYMTQPSAKSLITIQIRRYNEDTVLDKIEQYESEVL